MVFGNRAKNPQRGGGSPALVRTAVLAVALTTALLSGSGCGDGGQGDQAPPKHVRCDRGVPRRPPRPPYAPPTGRPAPAVD